MPLIMASAMTSLRTMTSTSTYQRAVFPKDGPSAGITMTTALISLLANIKVRADVAMTGEITLRGNVLAGGGIKEKARRQARGVKTIIMPKALREGPSRDTEKQP